MIGLPLLAQLTSAAIAATISASTTYGHYTVTSGAGLMPPASILRPDARPGEALHPLAEMSRTLAGMKHARAKTERNKAMIAWLASLDADFTVQRLEQGLVYDVRYRGADGTGAVLQDLVAVPFGAELPAAVRVVAAAGDDVQIETASCLAQATVGVVDRDGAQARAMAEAEAYLAAPEAGDSGLPADCLTSRLTRN